jgi:hypothetical protein
MSIDPADDYSDDYRPRLDDILTGSDGGFNERWEQTEAAADYSPVPAGAYRAAIVSVDRAESRANATPSVKLTLEIVDHPEYAGRRLYVDLWVTAAAIGVTKREAAKLGYATLAQLFQSPPIGDVLAVRVALRTGGDGRHFNRVVDWKVIDRARRLGVVAPDADGRGEKKGEVDTPAAVSPRVREGGQAR